LTEQPYGVVLAVLTGFSASTSPSAARTWFFEVLMSSGLVELVTGETIATSAPT
jgi:hypothetical protein